ncbi:MAG: SMP-30/gluconolactonase/LRE family protein [Haloarculaceae archaeon]
MAWEFEQVVSPREITEGPVWDGEGVIFSEIYESRILRYDEATGETEVYREDTNLANGLKFGPEGRLYACEQGEHRVVRYEPDGSATVVVADYEGTRLNRPNDLAIDDAGRVWFTDPYYGDTPEELELGHQSVYRADPVGEDEWELTRLTHEPMKPNGILVSPDGETLYVAQLDMDDGADKELRAYPIREDLSLGDYEVLHNFAPHRGIDGMCLDAEGNVVAAAGATESGPGAMIYVFAPSGRVLETHPVPGRRPTNCAFGGEDLRTLYVTGFDSGLHRARTDRRGYLGAP